MRRRLLDFYYEIKQFVQRGRRGWADSDVWSVDHYVASILIQMLKKLKETKQGSPIELTEEEWSDKLNQMIEAFEAANRVIEDEYYEEIGDDAEIIRKASKEELEECNRRLEADIKIFEDGMKIFTKYFFGLWD